MQHYKGLIVLPKFDSLQAGWAARGMRQLPGRLGGTQFVAFIRRATELHGCAENESFLSAAACRRYRLSLTVVGDFRCVPVGARKA